MKNMNELFDELSDGKNMVKKYIYCICHLNFAHLFFSLSGSQVTAE